MYVHASEKDGVLAGWIQDGSLDLFVWFEKGVPIHLQIVADANVVEWVAPGRLRTGVVRAPPRPGLAAASELIDVDRQRKSERVDAIFVAVKAAALAEEVKSFVTGLLSGKTSSEHTPQVERVFRAALERGSAR